VSKDLNWDWILAYILTMPPPPSCAKPMAAPAAAANVSNGDGGTGINLVFIYNIYLSPKFKSILIADSSSGPASVQWRRHRCGWELSGSVCCPYVTTVISVILEMFPPLPPQPVASHKLNVLYFSAALMPLGANASANLMASGFVRASISTAGCYCTVCC
jgi:hypothetical protein